jgi:formylglycine-generating enzyme required for sulfatase activity
VKIFLRRSKTSFTFLFLHMKKRFLALLLAAFGAGTAAQANNILVSNVSVSNQNTSSHFSLINFDVAWEHSFRSATNENNYDGAWMFVKFRKKNAQAWQHATLNYGTGGTAAASGHTQPAGSTLQTFSDSKGIMIYRDAVGSGDVTFTGAKVRWNYGADGLNDNDSVEVKVMAVEMVYVTTGSFVLGSSGNESNRFRRGDKDTSFIVTSNGALTVGATAANLSSSNATSLATGTIPAAYPKGFNAFWTMKYEVSQQQYADFLNTLDNAQATLRNAGTLTGTHPNLVAPAPERAMGSLSPDDVLSLLDWSALRPMTEMEYEKAARGYNQVAVPNEYAWGNTTIIPYAGRTNPGASNETFTIGNVAAGSAFQDFARTGAFATGTSNRVQSGASFYGIMDLSGNAYEFTVSANTTGRTFTAAHGDGNLIFPGIWDVTGWPTSAAGYAARGGSVNNITSQPLPVTDLQISDRSAYADYGSTVTTSRAANKGGRGVRTAE